MEKQNFKIEKTTVECYKIRHESGMYWADITIDVTGDRSGRISISSDYGNYANYWGACGGGLKKFLTEINRGYAADKFGADKWFDLDETLKKYKEHVLFSRREQHIKAERARDIFNEIKELEGCSGESEFVSQMWNSIELMRFFDGCPEMERTTTPQFRKFWDTVWPIFINAIKQEIYTDAVAN